MNENKIYFPNNEVLTVAALLAITPDRYGWRVTPGGTKIHLGNYTRIGNYTQIGNGTQFGDETRIGDGTQIGNGTQIGDGTRIGNYTRIGDDTRIGDGTRIGDDTQIGDGTQMVVSPPTLYGSRHPVMLLPGGHLRIGCQLHSLEWWSEHVEGCARQNDYSKAQGEEYRLYVEAMIVIHKSFDWKGSVHPIPTESAACAA